MLSAMKYLFAFFLLLNVSVQSVAQISDEKLLYMSKVTKFTNMKRTGIGLTIAGTVGQIVGVAMMLNSDDIYGYNGQSSNNDAEQGVIIYYLGTAAVGAGVPLWIVGGINKGRYERRLNNLSIDLKANPGSTGLALVYRF